MRYWLSAVLLGLMVSGPMSAFGLEPTVCETQATTAEMIQCEDWHYKQADRWLNQVYKNKLKYKDDVAKKLLRDAQRAWIKFRDAECSSQRDAGRGGTIAPLFELSCLTAMTEDRARALSVPQGLEGADFVPMLEQAGSSVIGMFKCDDEIQDAHVGLVPISPPGEQYVHARLEIGNDSLEWPIGGNSQDAFCGSDLTLSTMPHPTKPSCPALRVDDGMCDAFFVHWDISTKAFTWTRN